MTKTGEETTGAVSDVPRRVFTDFLDALVAKGIPTDIISRLRKTLLVDHRYSDKALKEAVFPETFDL